MPGTVRNPRLQFEEQIYPIWDSHFTLSSQASSEISFEKATRTPYSQVKESKTLLKTSCASWRAFLEREQHSPSTVLNDSPFFSHTLVVSFITFTAVSRIFLKTGERSSLSLSSFRVLGLFADFGETCWNWFSGNGTLFAVSEMLELAFRKWRAILAGSVYSVELAENMQEIPDYNQTNKTWKVFHHTEPILAQITTSLDPTKQTRFSPDAALTMFLSINPAVYIQTWRQFTILNKYHIKLKPVMLIVELVVHLHVRAILTTTRLIFFHVYARLCVKRVNRMPENVGSRALCSTSEREIW